MCGSFCCWFLMFNPQNMFFDINIGIKGLEITLKFDNKAHVNQILDPIWSYPKPQDLKFVKSHRIWI